ncbi:hypothetical protein HRR77_009608 [Exophiala dermatitidis]|nr:hypothetical protein HRR77_009608 [Exophiala dermatitidis]KAJ4695475.1 hypothetical protein HRR87_009304 [Exophiala dermatitidis]
MSFPDPFFKGVQSLLAACCRRLFRRTAHHCASGRTGNLLSAPVRSATLEHSRFDARRGLFSGFISIKQRCSTAHMLGSCGTEASNFSCKAQELIRPPKLDRSRGLRADPQGAHHY